MMRPFSLLLSVVLIETTSSAFITPSFVGRQQRRRQQCMTATTTRSTRPSPSSLQMATYIENFNGEDDDEESPPTTDIHGALLKRGDSVRIIQDLDDDDLKKGTIVTNIRCDDYGLGDTDVEGNVEGVGVFCLESKYLEKIPNSNDGIIRDVENMEISNGCSGILTRDYHGGLRMGTKVENITLLILEREKQHGMDVQGKIGPIYCPLKSQHIYTGELLEEEDLQEIKDDGFIRDAHGQILERGDSVYIAVDIRDSGNELKKGMKVYNIRFDEYKHGHDVEGNIEGLGVFCLESRTLIKIQGGNDGIVRDVEANEIKNGDDAVLIRDFEGGLKMGTKVSNITLGNYGNDMDVSGRIGDSSITCPLKSQYLYKVVAATTTANKDQDNNDNMKP